MAIAASLLTSRRDACEPASRRDGLARVPIRVTDLFAEFLTRCVARGIHEDGGTLGRDFVLIQFHRADPRFHQRVGF
jgi:hypothetical protein